MQPMTIDPMAGRTTHARVQIPASPYQGNGEVSFSMLHGQGGRDWALDAVSIADLLRNGFVYPPHSVYDDVKLATSGFDANQNLYDHPRFHWPFHASMAPSRPAAAVAVDDRALLATYHRLLCEAAERCTAHMQSPWFLQSGGKDSTSMAIAVAEASPRTTCLTYLGGHEENETDSARFVAKKLGLRHEVLVCDPDRAYDRYLALVPRMPLLTADFATVSYADLATEIGLRSGDGIIDALGSDAYFGLPIEPRKRVLLTLARGLRLPSAVFGLSPIRRSFTWCYALATLQMNSFERFFPGSRFTDAETDALLGRPIASRSRQRREAFLEDTATADSWLARRQTSVGALESAIYAKGMYVADALSLRLVYPYCDERLRNWVFNEVPDDRLLGPGGVNKVLVRQHIAEHFQHLPYVEAKGSFRFDVCGLAQQRFDQVHAFALQTQALLPGAAHWLEAHRGQLDNKYFASKFYLLAVILPWLDSRLRHAGAATGDEATQ